MVTVGGLICHLNCDEICDRKVKLMVFDPCEYYMDLFNDVQPED